MRPLPFASHSSKTLLVDAKTAHGALLVEQLNRAGFEADFAVSWGSAHAALGPNHYHSCVVVADLDQETDRDQIYELRRVAPLVWMIVLSDHPSERALSEARRHDLDALLLAPFSIHELTSRLAAFSLRSRPTYY
jgi:DNA-binding response OmpR family regulator